MLLQSAVLITLFFALDLAVRNRVPATIRYAVWMQVLAKLVAAVSGHAHGRRLLAVGGQDLRARQIRVNFCQEMAGVLRG